MRMRIPETGKLMGLYNFRFFGGMGSNKYFLENYFERHGGGIATDDNTKLEVYYSKNLRSGVIITNRPLSDKYFNIVAGFDFVESVESILQG